MTDMQWNWWNNALIGNRGELTRGDPKSGFYRDGKRACAIWRDADGVLRAAASSGFCPRTPEEIDDAFGRWSMRPISHETYMAFINSGQWPDDVDLPTRGIGDNLASMAPHEAMAAEIADLLERFQSWLKTLPNGIENDTQDAKAANYAKEIAVLGKKADETHKAEKAPHLEAGRAVDATWKPIVAAADAAKKAILAPTTDYRRKRAAAEEKARQAELSRLREEAERAHAKALEEAAAAAAAGEQDAPTPPPRPAPVALPPKRATGLRTVKVVIIDDLPALAAQLAAMASPPEDFVDACRKAARKVLEAGAEAKGARLVEEQRAA